MNYIATLTNLTDQLMNKKVNVLLGVRCVYIYMSNDSGIAIVFLCNKGPILR